MAVNNPNPLPPIPQDKIEENPRWREWFRNLGYYIQQAQGGGVVWAISQGGTGATTAAGARFNLGLGSISVQDSDNVTITGGAVSGVVITGSSVNSTPIGQTTPAAGAFTTSLTRDGYTVKPNCYVEAYDLSTTIALTSTPTILAPANTISGGTGITYNSSTGVFTFAEEGDYSLSLSVNATSSAANQFLYIYAQNNTGSGWVNNTNSGKFYNLTNGVTVQIVYSQSVHRVAGQQVRYYIYSNDGHVSLGTQTLPTVTPSVYVPAIRIQYS